MLRYYDVITDSSKSVRFMIKVFDFADIRKIFTNIIHVIYCLVYKLSISQTFTYQDTKIRSIQFSCPCQHHNKFYIQGGGMGGGRDFCPLPKSLIALKRPSLIRVKLQIQIQIQIYNFRFQSRVQNQVKQLRWKVLRK